MKFRTRLVLAATVAVAVAVLAACAAAFVYSRSALVASVDDSLQFNATSALQNPPLDNDSADGNILQVVALDGTVVVPGHPVVLPVTDDVLRVAATQDSGFYSNTTVHGVSMRELVTPLPTGTEVESNGIIGRALAEPGALQLAYPLTGVNDQLRHLGLVLGLVAVMGVALAILLGWLVGRTALVPLNGLTASVEDVANTIDVSRRLDAGGPDELGRLRRAFNRLLSALERSQNAQRQLVLDASHELRTPLTSLRTNLEVVRRLEELSPADREVLVADVLTQLEELTHLVADLAELARGEHPDHPAQLIRLDRLVEDAVAFAVTTGRSRGVGVWASTEPTWVRGRRDGIERAVGNLLDNAVKWSPDGAAVEVTCVGGEVSVRDHGPGIAAEDLPHVFDRFYRSPKARALPGSGLGLAIVAQVAGAEGGSVTAGNAVGGGAVLRLTIPTVSPPAAGRTDGVPDDGDDGDDEL